MGRLVSVDLETSGLDSSKHEVIEVGLVFEKDQQVETVEFSLPFDIRRADPRALEINGWGKRVFPDNMDRARAVGYLQIVLNDAHILGKNPCFDAGFLTELFRQYGARPVWHHRLVDVGSVAMGAYRQREVPNTERVEELTGMPLEGRHGALNDAKWVWDTFHLMTADQ